MTVQSLITGEENRGGAGKAAVSSDHVVVAGTNGTVWGLDKSSGAGLWQQDALLRRSVTAPAIAIE